MKMLDYVQLAHVRMGENLERSSELVAQLVDIFQSGSFDALRIVASGSSRHDADCARDYLQDALQMQVSVVTPEAFVDFEHTYPQHALNIAVSQSGYSTNTIAALDYMRAHDMAAVALTANVEAPIKEHGLSGVYRRRSAGVGASCEYRRCAIERYGKNGAAHGPSQG